MKVSVYLHKPIAETLLCYGQLSDVINKVLDACESGEIDIMDKPKIPPRDGATRFDVEVTNDYYISLVDTFTPNSPRISLRRLLYWFVENEVFNDLGWEVIRPYVSAEKERILKKLTAIIGDVTKLRLKLNDDEVIWANIVLDNLDNLKETVKSGR